MTTPGAGERNARWKALEEAVLKRRKRLPKPAAKALLAFVIAVVIAALAGAWLYALDLVVGSSRPAAAIGAAVTIVAAAVVARLTRFYEFWVPWRYDDRRFSDVYGSVMLAFAALTVGTVAFATFLDLANLSEAIWVLPEDGGRQHHPDGPALTRDGLVALSSEYYVWNFLDGIPVLEITESVNWHRDRTFTDHWNGILLLIFKLAVVLPIIALVVRSLRAKEPQ